MQRHQGIRRHEGIHRANGVDLAYESFGDPSNETMLLIAGMGVQRLYWPDAMCAALAAGGYYVVRYDNRDVGASTWTDGRFPGGAPSKIARTKLGHRLSVGPTDAHDARYDLDTLALDAVGLLDALGVARAHLVGFSMGGMIAQLVAATYPGRVATLTSIMSSTNDRDLPMPTARALQAILKPPASEAPDVLAAHAAWVNEVIGSPAFPTPRELRTERALRAIERAYNPIGAGHHMLAVLATGGFSDRLHAVEAPTLVLHGDRDPLVRVEGGRRTAASIRGARLEIIEGMGHDFPDQLVPRLTESILGNAERAEGSSPSEVSTSSATVDHEVIVVGAGFAGLGAAIKLRETGIDDFLILERAQEVGGTWRDNSYPGCACDVMSHLYSFSFEPNPHWTRKYAGWREIGDYLRGVAKKHDLYRQIRFGAALGRARWNDADSVWELSVDGDETPLRARSVIFAVGPLSNPAVPNIPGRETFSGPAFHSAQWDHDLDLAGKRVAVIGTGASAIQFVPHVARAAAQTTLFQRTPPWILPKPDRAFTGAERARFAGSEAYRKAYRAFLYARNEVGLHMFLKTGTRFGAFIEQQCRNHIERAIDDPSLRAKVTPDYEIGCKRILISNDYYPALNRADVSVETSDIVRIEPDAVVTADGARHEVDVIIWGTGFQVQRPLGHTEVLGRDGVSLEAQWDRDGFATYLGTTVSGFPNAFVLAGPNTGIGHTSLVYMIEAQLAYTMEALGHLHRGALQTVDARPEAQRGFTDWVQQRLEGTVWTAGGCNSWYLSDTGRNFTIWPDYTFKFRERMRRFDLGAFRAGVRQVDVTAPVALA